jgi:hypothetical protein
MRFKSGVNSVPTVFQLIHYFFTFGLLLVLTGCANEPGAPAAMRPWQAIRVIATSGPQEGIALLADSEHTLAAWPGDVQTPGLRLLDLSQPGEPLILPLGTTPRQASLFAAPGHGLQLLWLDQTALGEIRLVGALLGADRQVERGPTTISTQTVSDYTALYGRSGNLLTFWVNSGEQTSSLYFQEVDNAGRPRQAVRLSASAARPSAAFDAQGILRVAWLEPGPPHQWTIHYAAFPSGEPSTGMDTAIGSIQLEADQSIESFSLGTDATYVYCLWSIITVRQGSSLSTTLAGLSFPSTDSAATRSLAFGHAALAGKDLRWPALLSQAGSFVLVAVSATDKATKCDSPLILTLTPNGVNAVQPVIDNPEVGAIIGQTALTLAPDGRLHVAWPILRENGSAAIYYAASGRRAP